jgi:hypothetical protein
VYVLIPQVKSYGDYVNSNLVLQINVLNGVIACVVLAHIGFIIFGLFMRFGVNISTFHFCRKY